MRNLHTFSIPTANAPALYFLRGLHDYGIRVGSVGVGVQWVRSRSVPRPSLAYWDQRRRAEHI